MSRVADTRRQAIAELSRTRALGVDELAARFEVTTSTIRRDLALLAERGKIVRTFGGALSPASGEQTLHEREDIALVEKAAIAAEAERHIQPGQQLLLDTGTTVGALAERLAGWRDLTVVTSGLTVLNALADAEGIELIALGGHVRHLSQGLIGPLAERSLSLMTCDALFMGADGVSAARGLCEASAEQASLKRRMIARADHVYVLADASKLGRASSHWWTPLPARWTLITDAGATAAQLAPFRAVGGIQIITCRTRG